jgi:hypothetical protein
VGDLSVDGYFACVQFRDEEEGEAVKGLSLCSLPRVRSFKLNFLLRIHEMEHHCQGAEESLLVAKMARVTNSLAEEAG